MADDNKPMKYMRYAVGEILLVVIGILIALQINTWNNNRIDRKSEKAYLERFINDLEVDLENIQRSIESHEKRLLIGVDVLDQLGKNNNEQIFSWTSYKNASDNKTKYNNRFDTFGGKLFGTLMISLFYQTDNTFQELISTGKIDIISNQKLKTAIQQHYPEIRKSQNFQDRIVMTVQTNYRNALIENNISYLSRSSYKDLKNEIQNPSQLIVAIENYLTLSNAFLNGLYINENSMKKKTEELIIKIQTQLNTHSISAN